jgi:hypothetical protein
MYLRDQRNQSNVSLPAVMPGDAVDEMLAPPPDASVEYKIDPDFERRVIRQGTGDVRFTCVELLDDKGEIITQAEFNQQITVRLHLTFHAACSTNIGYHIRNQFNEGIIGTGTGVEGHPPLRGNAGDRFVVDYTTRVPIREGAYSISASASSVVADDVNRFNDMAEHVAILHVLPRLPRKIWQAAYVPNTLAVHYAGRGKECVCSLCGEAHAGRLPATHAGTDPG